MQHSQASPPHRGQYYRPDIDGLRAVAIVAVVAFHARLPFFGGGYVGVDVFLVISGYLIGALVYRDICDSRFSFLNFYERRAKRILPALLTVLVVCNLIAFALLSPLELRDYCAQAFSAVTSSSNIYFWLKSNYFNPVAEFKPLLMTWSLGIEEQFYLLFPLTLVLLFRFAKRRIPQIVAAGCLASFLLCVLCLRVYPSAAFYLLPMRAWELGLGVLIAVYEVQRVEPLRLGNKAAIVLAGLGLALILGSVVIYTQDTPFPGLAALLPTGGTVCLILSRDSFVNRRLLSSRPMVFLGLVSYSWYLWHWPLMSFARIVSDGFLPVSRAALIGVSSLALAVVSYNFVEQPFRRSPVRGGLLLPKYGLALVVLAALSFLGYARGGWPGRIPQLVKVEASVSSVETNPCLAGFDESAPRLMPPCVIESSGPKLALLGDSHAASLAPALEQVASEHGYGFELLAKASCRPLAGVTLHWALHPTFERTCSDFNRAALQRVANDDRTQIVVLAGYWSAPLAEDSKEAYADVSQKDELLSPAESGRNLEAGLLKTILLLRSAGKRVVVASDVPRLDLDPVDSVRNSVIRTRGELANVLSSHVLSLDSVPQQNLIKPADALADSEIRHAARQAGATILDLSRNLCPSGQCRFWNDGILFYSDSQHLTAAGAEYALRGQDPIASTN